MKKSEQHPDPGGLVGHFFHSIGPRGKIEWQGEIIGRPEPGLYLVQLFEWLFGEPSTRHLVRIEDMAGWLFYPDSEAMLYSWEHGEARQRRRARA